ncbi:hypothetical protein BX070DRAFT_229972 [Coemansia spiralis]|nr:hypothetical protein BX070DRAFT_229972 [Coemansia spiralis]
MVDFFSHFLVYKAVFLSGRMLKSKKDYVVCATALSLSKPLNCLFPLLHFYFHSPSQTTISLLLLLLRAHQTSASAFSCSALILIVCSALLPLSGLSFGIFHCIRHSSSSLPSFRFLSTIALAATKDAASYMK